MSKPKSAKSVAIPLVVLIAASVVVLIAASLMAWAIVIAIHGVK